MVVPAPQFPLDIYIRVSRKGSREQLQSPEDQEREARAFAAAQGLTVGIVLPLDIDEPGDTLDRPGLQEGLRRVRESLSGGMIVAYLSRASRDTPQGLGLLDQLTGAGGALYAPNLPDYTTADGRMLTTIQLAIDTGYRERKREEFERAKEGAIARGLPISTRPPVGYRRERRRMGDGRWKLVGPYLIDPKTAPHVREVFECRARGEGPAALGAFLEQQRVRTSQGSQTWAKQAVYGLLSNRVYLGELSYGRPPRYVNATAHEPIVDLALWQAAQHPNGRRLAATRGGTYLLTGIARCAGCGYCLQGTRTSRGKRVYRCTRRHASGVCEAPATVDADAVEQAVIDAFWTHTANLEAEGTADPSDGLRELEDALRRAEEGLRQWASREVQEKVGDLSLYAAGLGERRAVRDRAAEALGQARAEADPSPFAVPTETLRAAWERMTTGERRELLGLRFDCLALRRDRSVTVYPAGTAPEGLPRQGFRRDPLLVPFPDPPAGARALAL